MISATLKSFAVLQPDYVFFQRHSTELDVVSHAMRAVFQGTWSPHHPGRILDFGSGDGYFLEETLKASGTLPKSWNITVLDIVEEYRQRATQRLTPWSKEPIRAWPTFPSPCGAQFDRVIANHVLYYVPSLSQTMNALWDATICGGRIYITIGHEEENIATAAWKAMFSIINKPIPYNLSSDVERFLNERRWPYSKHRLTSQLRFEDTLDNRQSLARLTFGENLPSINMSALVTYFDSYSSAGYITMALIDEFFCVEKQ